MANTGRAAQVGGQPGGQVMPLLTNPFWANLDPKVLRMPKDFFTYGVDFLPLAAAATQTLNIQINSDGHFLIMAGVRVATDPADPTSFTANVPVLASVFDGGSGRELMDQPVHIENLFGTAQLPAYWPYPKIVKSQSTMRVTLENLDPVNGFDVRIQFLGFKLFLSQSYKQNL